MSCPINKFTKTLQFRENRIGSGGPDKRALVSVVVGDVVIDFVHQFTHAAERTAPDRLLGDEREPALDLIEPAGVGGSVVEVVARMADQPGFDLGVLVGGVVVGDQMDFEFARDAAVEMIEKREELLVPMARLALRDDCTIEDVERRKQGSGAVSIVVVSDALDVAKPHRQHRLAALQGLDLTLLVYAQNQGLVRRIEISPTTSRTFSTKNGSVESLKLWLR